MGFFDFLKKVQNNVNEQVNKQVGYMQNNNNIIKNDVAIKTNNKVITSNDFKSNEKSWEVLGKVKENYTKEQVIALFLKSMSCGARALGDKDSYPRYMTYDYNILDVPKFHKELIDAGYFFPASFESILKDYRINELKNLLVLNNIECKGLKKEELIKLANSSLSDNIKQQIIGNKQMYEISEKGNQYIDSFKEFLAVINFKKFNINYSQYLEYKEKLPAYSSVRDVVWHIFNERLNFCYENKQVGMVRSLYLDMAQFLESEKPSSNVLYYYILVLYHDVNLDHTQQRILDFKSSTYISKKSLLEYMDSSPVADVIIQKIKEFSEYHDDKIFDKIFNRKLLPYKFLSDDDFRKMINEIYSTSFFEAKKYVNKAKKNAKDIINNL